MIPFEHAVYFLGFGRTPFGDGTVLAFVHDIADDTRTSWSNMGLFVFPRRGENRRKPRELVFPAVSGFGENAREFNVLLRSRYREDVGSNKFRCEPDQAFPFLSALTFTARELPKPVRLEGSAAVLAPFSLWELVPDDRAELERLWREAQFYFLGVGKRLG
ncbi:hypothetical protein [Pseudoduganella chitinolytica]|uniref:Uncharacterized protein n=1 Tax=Pseudoduganella chitinolytica TaxID=34070 RepID=A0ABY8BF22_9BURK|nr:hypothetical protein [Pseudoduganella chitinolytica]WEF32944.1 hypothetical protein PX653_26715 [Pseudoduganella chitinolytica]